MDVVVFVDNACWDGERGREGPGMVLEERRERRGSRDGGVGTDFEEVEGPKYDKETEEVGHDQVDGGDHHRIRSHENPGRGGGG